MNDSTSRKLLCYWQVVSRASALYVVNKLSSNKLQSLNLCRQLIKLPVIALTVISVNLRVKHWSREISQMSKTFLVLAEWSAKFLTGISYLMHKTKWQQIICDRDRSRLTYASAFMSDLYYVMSLPVVIRWLPSMVLGWTQRPRPFSRGLLDGSIRSHDTCVLCCCQDGHHRQQQQQTTTTSKTTEGLL